MLSHESPGSAIMSNSFNCFLVIISALGASDALAYSPVHGCPKTAMPRELAWRTCCICSRQVLALSCQEPMRPNVRSGESRLPILEGDFGF